MAEIYVDMDGGGSDTSPWDTWAQAAPGIEKVTALAGAGDNVWVQGNHAGLTVDAGLNWQTAKPGNPVVIMGVRNGTTNEPPVATDLIPGKYTGEATLVIDGGTDAELLDVGENITNDTQTGSGNITRISVASAGSDPTMTITIVMNAVTGKFENNDTLSSTDEATFSGSCSGDLLPYAWQALGDDAPPSYRTTASDDIVNQGCAWHYGILYLAGEDFETGLGGSNVSEMAFVECGIQWGLNTNANFWIGQAQSATIEQRFEFFDCELRSRSGATNGIKINAHPNHHFFGGVWVPLGTPPTVLLEGGLSNESGGRVSFHGFDFSAHTGDLVNEVHSSMKDLLFSQCLFGAGWSAMPGNTPLGDFELRIDNCGTVTGKSSGSLTDMEWHTFAGAVIRDATVVRTGGAQDPEGTQFAWKMTPRATDMTRRGYYGLRSPWIWGWTDGTDTSIKVYISNSLAESSPANDYHDDQVWLEIMYPSALGTNQASRIDTRMPLLATPADLPSDGSTWGSGGNNAQTITATIAPDYAGPIMVRVLVATGAVDSVYVDPLLEIS